MKRTFLKILSLYLILPLSFMSVLCCNFSSLGKISSSVQGNYTKLSLSTAPVAQPSNVSIPSTHAEKFSPCHTRSAKTDVPTKNDCHCCFPKLQAVYSPAFSLYIPQSAELLIVLDFLSQPISILKGKFSLAYLDGSPPGLFGDLPLYIHFHNFRI